MKNDQENLPFLKTKIGLLIAILVAGLLLVGLFGFFKKLNASNKNKKQEQEKLEFYQSEKVKIESRLSEINSEDGIEKTVRENYNLTKDGEGLVVIVEEEDIEISASHKREGSFWDFWRRIFSKK